MNERSGEKQRSELHSVKEAQVLINKLLALSSSASAEDSAEKGGALRS